ncbi:hypothetical protein L1887_28654 [Cichorium endivia]|nr:hypothetical protein L1887_28654 [Cichorium endivia]
MSSTSESREAGLKLQSSIEYQRKQNSTHQKLSDQVWVLLIKRESNTADADRIIQATSSMAPSSPVDAKPSSWQSPVRYRTFLEDLLPCLVSLLLLSWLLYTLTGSSSSDNGVGVEDGDVENGNGDGNSKANNSIDYQLHPVAKQNKKGINSSRKVGNKFGLKLQLR